MKLGLIGRSFDISPLREEVKRSQDFSHFALQLITLQATSYPVAAGALSSDADGMVDLISTDKAAQTQSVVWRSRGSTVAPL